MADYQFTAAQRYAIYTVYGGRCYLRGEPVDLQSMEVDHVIPESLLKEPAKLAEILKALGRPPDFDLNSFENWLPSCRQCNQKKSDAVFELTPLIQLVLQQAAANASRAKELAEETTSRIKISRALNVIERASEQGELVERDIESLVPLVEFHFKKRSSEIVPAPLRLTPLFQVLSEDGNMRIVRVPYGVGYQPKGDNIHSSFYCGHCGSLGPWSGARCLTCGHLSDD